MATISSLHIGTQDYNIVAVSGKDFTANSINVVDDLTANTVNANESIINGDSRVLGTLYADTIQGTASNASNLGGTAAASFALKNGNYSANGLIAKSASTAQYAVSAGAAPVASHSHPFSSYTALSDKPSFGSITSKNTDDYISTANGSVTFAQISAITGTGASQIAKGNHTHSYLASVAWKDVSGLTGTTSTTLARGDHSHSNYVPTGRKVNGKVLSADVTIGIGDISNLGTYTGYAKDWNDNKSTTTAKAASGAAASAWITAHSGDYLASSYDNLKTQASADLTAQSARYASNADTVDGVHASTFASASQLANYKPVQTAATATGSTVKTVTSVVQNASGVVTITYSDIRGATTGQTGITQLTSTVDGTTENKAITPKGVSAYTSAAVANSHTHSNKSKLDKYTNAGTSANPVYIASDGTPTQITKVGAASNADTLGGAASSNFTNSSLSGYKTIKFGSNTFNGGTSVGSTLEITASDNIAFVNSAANKIGISAKDTTYTSLASVNSTQYNNLTAVSASYTGNSANMLTGSTAMVKAGALSSNSLNVNGDVTANTVNANEMVVNGATRVLGTLYADTIQGTASNASNLGGTAAASFALKNGTYTAAGSQLSAYSAVNAGAAGTAGTATNANKGKNGSTYTEFGSLAFNSTTLGTMAQKASGDYISTSDGSVKFSQVSAITGTGSDKVAVGNHTHGNIQNGGTLQTSDITIANGDKLVVTDSSDSNKIARTSIAFDGSTETVFLSKKGTWATPTNDKNTAGSTNKASTKLYLVGAASQAENTQTFSNSNCYIGTDNKLYSNGSVVLTSYSNTIVDSTDVGTYFNSTSAKYATSATKVIWEEAGTVDKERPIGMSFNDDNIIGKTGFSIADGVAAKKDFSYNTSTKRLTVPSAVKIGNCTLQWNSTTNSLDFNF